MKKSLNLKLGYSHSFDVAIAVELGWDSAVMYNHILYWLKHNKITGKNQHEGKTWTYDSHAKMTHYMPYLSERMAEIALKKLVDAEILVKGNFNKSKFDRTNWYALKDESILQLSNNSSDATKSWHRRHQSEDSMPRFGGMDDTPRCDASYIYPDIDTDTSSSADADCAPPAIADQLANDLLSSIKSIKEDFKPQKFKEWVKQIDLMIRIDKRDIERIKQIIQWLPNEPFWSIKILSGSSLRKNFDALELKKDEKIAPSKTNLKDKIRSHFKNYSVHNGVECFINEKGIGFQRGMTHCQVNFADYGFKDQFQNMISKFGIDFDLS